MDFRPTEEQKLLRRTVREFAETEIRPHVREWDQDQRGPPSCGPLVSRSGASPRVETIQIPDS